MISFDCPSCGKGLKAPDEGAGRDGRCSCGATFTIPRIGETAEPIDCDDDIPIRRRKKSHAPPALVIGGVFALGAVTVLVVVMALMRNSGTYDKPKDTAKQDSPKSGRTERPTRTAPIRDERTPDTDDEPSRASRRNTADDVDVRGNIITTVVILIVLLYILTSILLAIWVIRDCRNRSVENGVIWMLLIFPFNCLALLVYLASRPNGTLIRCESCRNKRLPFVGVCPHCHVEVRVRGMSPD